MLVPERDKTLDELREIRQQLRNLTESVDNHRKALDDLQRTIAGCILTPDGQAPRLLVGMPCPLDVITM